jgi:hypothetical protein
MHLFEATEIEGVEEQLERAQRLGAVLGAEADQDDPALAHTELDNRG